MIYIWIFISILYLLFVFKIINIIIYIIFMETKIENFNLKNSWILWFHKVNDNNWKLESYLKIHEIKTYYDFL